MIRQRRNDEDRPLYMISVAAELSGMHPQTLRIYERRELVKPQRSAGNTRLYSDSDIDRLRLIQQLTQEEGINLAGVERILELETELARAHREIERLRERTEEMHARFIREVDNARRERKAELVMVRGGGLALRYRGGER